MCSKMGNGQRKRHQILNVPTIFNLPYTEDGNMTKTEQYSLIGLLCHSGNEHQHGHFFAVFVYRGVYWNVDDGSIPRPVPETTDCAGLGNPLVSNIAKECDL